MFIAVLVFVKRAFFTEKPEKYSKVIHILWKSVVEKYKNSAKTLFFLLIYPNFRIRRFHYKTIMLWDVEVVELPVVVQK